MGVIFQSRFFPFTEPFKKNECSQPEAKQNKTIHIKTDTFLSKWCINLDIAVPRDNAIFVLYLIAEHIFFILFAKFREQMSTFCEDECSRTTVLNLWSADPREELKKSWELLHFYKWKKKESESGGVSKCSGRLGSDNYNCGLFKIILFLLTFLKWTCRNRTVVLLYFDFLILSWWIS